MLDLIKFLHDVIMYANNILSGKNISNIIILRRIMEDKDFEESYKIIKALSDVNRMMILHTLTSGEKCACKILADFNIKQPTLSHHMKILTECGLVSSRKEGKWMHYSLNVDKIEQFQTFITDLTSIK